MKSGITNNIEYTNVLNDNLDKKNAKIKQNLTKIRQTMDDLRDSVKPY